MIRNDQSGTQVFFFGFNHRSYSRVHSFIESNRKDALNVNHPLQSDISSEHHLNSFVRLRVRESVVYLPLSSLFVFHLPIAIHLSKHRLAITKPILLAGTRNKTKAKHHLTTFSLASHFSLLYVEIIYFECTSIGKYHTGS